MKKGELAFLGKEDKEVFKWKKGAYVFSYWTPGGGNCDQIKLHKETANTQRN